MPLVQSHPPTVHHARRPASPSEALTHLTSYLADAQTQPALQPNAELTTDGPAFSAYSAADNTAMRLLERVRRGLAGEYVAPEPGSLLLRGDAALRDAAHTADSLDALAAASEPAVEMQRRVAEVQGWLDPQEYAEAQEYATAVNSEAGEGGDEEGGGAESEEDSERGSLADEEERRGRREEMKYARIHGDADGLDDSLQGDTIVKKEAISDSKPVKTGTKKKPARSKGK